MKIGANNILIAVDLSSGDGCLASTRLIGSITKSEFFSSSNISLLYVVPDDIHVLDGYVAPYIEKWNQQNFEKGQKKMAELLSNFPELKFKSFEVVSENKSVAEDIVDKSLELDSFMLVLAPANKGSIKEVLLGSVSKRVIALSTLPVLLVPGF